MLILGYFCVVIPFSISGKRLAGYVKAKYPDVYSTYIEQGVLLVEIFYPKILKKIIICPAKGRRGIS